MQECDDVVVYSLSHLSSLSRSLAYLGILIQHVHSLKYVSIRNIFPILPILFQLAARQEESISLVKGKFICNLVGSGGRFPESLSSSFKYAFKLSSNRGKQSSRGLPQDFSKVPCGKGCRSGGCPAGAVLCFFSRSKAMTGCCPECPYPSLPLRTPRSGCLYVWVRTKLFRYPSNPERSAAASIMVYSRQSMNCTRCKSNGLNRVCLGKLVGSIALHILGLIRSVGIPSKLGHSPSLSPMAYLVMYHPQDWQNYQLRHARRTGISMEFLQDSRVGYHSVI